MKARPDSTGSGELLVRPNRVTANSTPLFRLLPLSHRQHFKGRKAGNLCLQMAVLRFVPLQAARPSPGNGNKRQRPNPRTDLKRGRETEERETSGGAGPGHTELNIRNQTRLEALSRRYPGKLELRAPQKATLITLRMQAQTAARFEDVFAHVTFTGTGGKDSRLVPLWDQTRIWDPGD